MLLSEFNELDNVAAEELLIRCCHSSRWARGMLKARPFVSMTQLLNCAGSIWRLLGESDFLEAFSGHARIGDMNALREKFSAAAREQGQIADAPEPVLWALAEGNRIYAKKNGFIFIVCASGKSASEMLDLLVSRQANSRAEELVNAAAEQARITELRLKQLVQDD